MIKRGGNDIRLCVSAVYYIHDILVEASHEIHYVEYINLCPVIIIILSLSLSLSLSPFHPPPPPPLYTHIQQLWDIAGKQFYDYPVYFMSCGTMSQQAISVCHHN